MRILKETIEFYTGEGVIEKDESKKPRKIKYQCVASYYEDDSIDYGNYMVKDVETFENEEPESIECLITDVTEDVEFLDYECVDTKLIWQS